MVIVLKFATHVKKCDSTPVLDAFFNLETVVEQKMVRVAYFSGCAILTDKTSR